MGTPWATYSFTTEICPVASARYDLKWRAIFDHERVEPNAGKSLFQPRQVVTTKPLVTQGAFQHYPGPLKNETIVCVVGNTLEKLSSQDPQLNEKMKMALDLIREEM